jgi:PAS domain S-box-containing protein
VSAVDDERRSRLITPGAGGYVFLSGLISFCGWAFDVPRLTDWDGRGISIQPNTSIAAAATGLALLLVGPGYRRAVLVLGLVPGLIGAATLLEYASGIDLGIDTLLMFDRPWGGAGTLAPGRMGPAGSLSWTLTGLALLFTTRSETRQLVPLLGLLVASIAGLSLTGYLFGANPLYTVPWLTAIAIQTSTFLLAAGLGLVASVPEREPFRTLIEDSSAGMLARRTLVWMIVLPLVLGYVRIQAQRAGLFDTAMGTALLVLALIVIMCGVLWRSVRVVSARERALVTTDRALRASETRLTTLLEQLPLGIGVFDLEGRLLIANPMLRRFTRDRLPSRDSGTMHRWRSWESDGTPIDSSQWPGARALAGATVDPGVDFLYSGDDGSDIWTRVSAAPFRDAHGAIVGVIWVVQDIDERKRAENALAAKERQLRLVADHAPVLIAHCDAGARYKFVNRGYAERFGLTPQQVIGKRIPEVVGEEAYAAFEGYVADALAGQAVEFETEIPYRTGGPQYMHVAYVPERDADGVVGLVAAIVNITERRRAEEALRVSEQRLRRQADELQEADRKKDEFLATLAHELRNPLAPLRTGLQILKHAKSDPALAERTRTTMERQVEHLVRLIDDLLDVSRITSGRIALTTERVALAAVIEQAVNASKPAIDARDHRLTVIAPSEALAVEVDEARMVQVFSNLLNNAAKFTPRGGEITLAIGREADTAVVSIRDTGVGIPTDMLARVFDRFTQVDRSLERPHSGLGIGLSLVKGLLDLHGGSVEARSGGPGQGSEFIVRLALAVTQAVEACPPAAADAPRAMLPRRILVVDDNVDAANGLAMILALEGHDTETAHDGEEAIEKAAARPPDVILLDIGMPKLNGYDTCRRIRGHPWGKNIMLVALTGWGQEEDRRRSHDAGFDGHIVKPVDSETLRKILA